jgi:hypothetical protein
MIGGAITAAVGGTGRPQAGVAMTGAVFHAFGGATVPTKDMMGCIIEGSGMVVSGGADADMFRCVASG